MKKILILLLLLPQIAKATLVTGKAGDALDKDPSTFCFDSKNKEIILTNAQEKRLSQFVKEGDSLLQFYGPQGAFFIENYQKFEPIYKKEENWGAGPLPDEIFIDLDKGKMKFCKGGFIPIRKISIGRGRDTTPTAIEGIWRDGKLHVFVAAGKEGAVEFIVDVTSLKTIMDTTKTRKLRSYIHRDPKKPSNEQMGKAHALFLEGDYLYIGYKYAQKEAGEGLGFWWNGIGRVNIKNGSLDWSYGRYNADVLGVYVEDRVYTLMMPRYSELLLQFPPDYYQIPQKYGGLIVFTKEGSTVSHAEKLLIIDYMEDFKKTMYVADYIYVPVADGLWVLQKTLTEGVFKIERMIHTQTTQNLCVKKRGKYLYVASSGNYIAVIDTETWKLASPPILIQPKIWDIEFREIGGKTYLYCVGGGKLSIAEVDGSVIKVIKSEISLDADVRDIWLWGDYIFCAGEKDGEGLLLIYGDFAPQYPEDPPFVRYHYDGTPPKIENITTEPSQLHEDLRQSVSIYADAYDTGLGLKEAPKICYAIGENEDVLNGAHWSSMQNVGGDTWSITINIQNWEEYGGKYIFAKIKCKDIAENEVISPLCTFSIKPRNDPPTLSLIEPTGDVKAHELGYNVNIKWKAQDKDTQPEFSLKEVSIYLLKDTQIIPLATRLSAEGVWTWNILSWERANVTLKRGNYSIKVVATDKVEEKDEKTINIYINHPPSAPVVLLSGALEDGIITIGENLVTLYCTIASDVDGDSLKYKFFYQKPDGSIEETLYQESTNYTLDTEGFSDGKYILWARSTDGELESADSEKKTFWIDREKSPPIEPSIKKPGSNEVIKSSKININFVGEDPDPIEQLSYTITIKDEAGNTIYSIQIQGKTGEERLEQEGRDEQTYEVDFSNIQERENKRFLLTIVCTDPVLGTKKESSLYFYINERPEPPSISLTKKYEGKDVQGNVTLSASGQDQDPLQTHTLKYRFILAKDALFNNVIKDSGWIASKEYVLLAQELEENTLYYWRALCYHSDDPQEFISFAQDSFFFNQKNDAPIVTLEKFNGATKGEEIILLKATIVDKDINDRLSYKVEVDDEENFSSPYKLHEGEIIYQDEVQHPVNTGELLSFFGKEDNLLFYWRIHCSDGKVSSSEVDTVFINIRNDPPLIKKFLENAIQNQYIFKDKDTLKIDVLAEDADREERLQFVEVQLFDEKGFVGSARKTNVKQGEKVEFLSGEFVKVGETKPGTLEFKEGVKYTVKVVCKDVGNPVTSDIEKYIYIAPSLTSSPTLSVKNVERVYLITKKENDTILIEDIEPSSLEVLIDHVYKNLPDPLRGRLSYTFVIGDMKQEFTEDRITLNLRDLIAPEDDKEYPCSIGISFSADDGKNESPKATFTIFVNTQNTPPSIEEVNYKKADETIYPPGSIEVFVRVHDKDKDECVITLLEKDLTLIKSPTPFAENLIHFVWLASCDYPNTKEYKKLNIKAKDTPIVPQRFKDHEHFQPKESKITSQNILIDTKGVWTKFIKNEGEIKAPPFQIHAKGVEDAMLVFKKDVQVPQESERMAKREGIVFVDNPFDVSLLKLDTATGRWTEAAIKRGDVRIRFSYEGKDIPKPETLSLFVLQRGRWTKADADFMYEPGYVNFWPYTLSIFRIGYKMTATFTLDDVKVYPNPCKKGPVYFKNIPVDGVILKIYTLDGVLVYEERLYPEKNVWNMKNKAGEEVASGIYIYVLKDNAGRKKIGKIAIIR